MIDEYTLLTITLFLGLFIVLLSGIGAYYWRENRRLVKVTQLILDSAQAGLVKSTLTGVCEEANSPLCILFGATREGILSMGWLGFVDTQDKEQVTDEWADAVAAQKDYAREFRIKRPDGSIVWVQCYASLYMEQDQRPNCYIITFYNIESLKRTELALKDLSYKDELTGLPNRRYFKETLKHAIDESLRYRRPFTVMYIDLDHFKQINDQKGHAAGDTLLVEIGSRFKHMIRGTDFIARIGGDEFCMIMREASSPEAVNIMTKRLMDTMKEPILIAGQPFQITLSIGVVVYSNETLTADDIMQHADEALYRAKAAGRNNAQIY